jgi:hypothetical protein
VIFCIDNARVCARYLYKKIGANTYSYLKYIVYDKLLQPQQSFLITLYRIAGHATDGNITYAHCMLDTKHTPYMILIAFPVQQWLRERASVLRYTCTARLVL